jgi:hypothetical protein
MNRSHPLTPKRSPSSSFRVSHQTKPSGTTSANATATSLVSHETAGVLAFPRSMREQDDIPEDLTRCLLVPFLAGFGFRVSIPKRETILFFFLFIFISTKNERNRRRRHVFSHHQCKVQTSSTTRA